MVLQGRFDVMGSEYDGEGMECGYPFFVIYAFPFFYYAIAE